METTEYFLGQQAYRNGESLDDNPFDINDKSDAEYWQDWADGYLDEMTNQGYTYTCGCGLCEMSHLEYNPEAVEESFKSQ